MKVSVSIHGFRSIYFKTKKNDSLSGFKTLVSDKENQVTGLELTYLWKSKFNR